MSAIEGCAVALALAYVLLAIYQRRLCWIASIASASLYIIIFWQVQLYLEAVLQICYIAMAIFGWFAWTNDDDQAGTAIRTWPPRRHAAACGLILLLSLTLGGVMSSWSDAASPFIDAATTVSALLATWMVAQKLLENWLYWIIIDLASIGLYLSRDLALTAALFAGYVLLAWLGYRTWRNQWRLQQID
ncbi:MAG: nicotinamide riboside transporter PnuC [Luminiphilus sp.]|nr:nicotinamide riboside transporter PnuC [Luminiphilus sp.]